MSLILHIETSAKICSVALSQEGAVIFERQSDGTSPSHAVDCGVFVQEALSFAESHAIPLDAVAVSEGPGSYTGLRIGYSMAKGVAYGRGVRLISLPTLEVMCVPVLLYHDLPEDALLVPMIDARRMEVYTAVFDRAMRPVLPTQPMIVTAESFAHFSRPMFFFGDGAEKCEAILPGQLIKGLPPLAKNMVPLAEKAIALGQEADVAYSVPQYLKEFQATKAKQLL